MNDTLKKSLVLFQVFASISAVSLGGGMVMLPVMTREFVEKRKWLSNEDMLDTIAVMQSLPGIISVNMSALIGFRIAGVTGAAAGACGVVLPPIITILFVAICLSNFLGTPAMDKIFTGVRAAACALILLSNIKMGKKILVSPLAVILAAAAFIAALVFNVNVIALIVIGALVGYGAFLANKLGKKP